MIELEKKSKKKCCYQKNIGVESSRYSSTMLGFIHSSGHKEVVFSSFFTAIAYVWMFLWCNRKGYKTFYAFIITFVQKNLIISHCCFHRLSNVRGAATGPHHVGNKKNIWMGEWILHRGLCANVLECSLFFGHEKFIFRPGFSCYYSSWPIRLRVKFSFICNPCHVGIS